MDSRLLYNYGVLQGAVLGPTLFLIYRYIDEDAASYDDDTIVMFHASSCSDNIEISKCIAFSLILVSQPTSHVLLLLIYLN